MLVKLIFALSVCSAFSQSEEILVVKAPHWMKFNKVSAPLPTSQLSSIVLSLFGLNFEPISWDGFQAGNGFQRPKAVIIFAIEGMQKAELTMPAVISFNTVTDGVPESSLVASQLHSEFEKPLIMDVNPATSLNSLSDVDLMADFPTSASELEKLLTSGKSLFSSYVTNVSKDFLMELHLADQLISAVQTSKLSTDQYPDFMYLQLPALSFIVDKDERKIALHLLSQLLETLSARLDKIYAHQALVMTLGLPAIRPTVIRSRRSLQGSVMPAKAKSLKLSNQNVYNLAIGYSPDFPITFNITLWLMVALGLTLLAVCYGMWHMDPGRDSIIYRMTTTRIKKD